MVRRAAELVAGRGVFRFSGRQLLVTLIIFFISFPFLNDAAWSGPIFSWLFTLVLFSALLAVGGRRRVMIGGLLLLTPVLLLHWLPSLTRLRADHPLNLASYCLFVGFVVINLLRYVLRTPRVDAEVLAAGVSIYLMLGWFWTFLFQLCLQLQPTAFGPASGSAYSLFDLFYFSFTTLTTAGYGDIVPVTRPARMLAAMESVCGVLYLAVLVARLVALYTSQEEPS